MEMSRAEAWQMNADVKTGIDDAERLSKDSGWMSKMGDGMF